LRRAITLAVESLGVTPGQRLRLWAEARDGDPSGPNLGRARPVSLQVVSGDDFVAEMARRELELRREFEHLLSAQRGLKDALERLLTHLAPEAEPVASLAQQIAALSRRQEAHAGRCLLLGRQFEQLLAEMRTSRVVRAAEQRRISDRIVAPLDSLGTTFMPAASAEIANLRGVVPATRWAAVGDTQVEILRRMQAILANMLKREGYREAVALLQEVIAEQAGVRAATLDALRQELETILGVDEPVERSPEDGSRP
jgi:hypothetical protein